MWSRSFIQYLRTGHMFPVVGALEWDHGMIHNGQAFTHSNRHTVLAAGVVDHVITPGASSMHLRVIQITSTGGPTGIVLYENPTGVSGGSTETIINNNRYSSRVAQATVTLNPTVGGVGTLLVQDLIPAPGGNGGNTGATPGGEIILKPGNTYLIRTTNEDTTQEDIIIAFWWYEPENDS